MNQELLTREREGPSFRTRLSAPRRTTLPETPSGRPISELDDEELGGVVGGRPRPRFNPTASDISNGF